MSDATAQTVVLPRRRRLAVWSVWIGLVTLTVALPIVVVYLKPIVLAYRGVEVSTGLADVVVRRLFPGCVKLALGPHFVGVTLGIVALFRHGDRRLLGLLGVVLNGLALLFFLMILGFAGAVE
jgi:hypothetical protein